MSKLTSDPRSAIRKGSLEVLFNILKDHGHLFSHQFWTAVFNSVIFPIFNGVFDKKDADKNNAQSPISMSPRPEGSTWDSETSAVAADCLIDLFVSFFDVVRSQLSSVISILTGLIRSPVQGPATTGVAALVRLASEVGSRLSEDEWREIFLALKEAATSAVPGFLKVLRTMDNINVPGLSESFSDIDMLSDQGYSNEDLEDDNLQTASYVVSRMKSHVAMQLLILQVSFLPSFDTDFVLIALSNFLCKYL